MAFSKQLSTSTRSSKSFVVDDAAAAKEKLIKDFKLNDEQATYILDMPLRRLTKMSKLELETESKELKATIAALSKLLKDDEAIRVQVSDELSAIAKSFAIPRRTRIGKDVPA